MKKVVILAFVSICVATLNQSSAHASGTEKKSQKPVVSGSGSERSMPDAQVKDKADTTHNSNTESDSVDAEQNSNEDAASHDGSGTEREIPKKHAGSGTERN